MRILGIDPGIGRAGWGIVEVASGTLQAESYGCIETHSGVPIGERLIALYEQLRQVIDDYKPDAVAIEELFFNTNAKTAFVVGQARGVMLLIVAQHQLPMTIYTPLQVKMAVSGYGRADKNQVGQMVKTILKLPAIPKPDDTADALAIAVTHAFSYKMER